MIHYAILKNALSGQVIKVRKAIGKTAKNKKIPVWIDEDGTFICVIGKESPSWETLSVNGEPFTGRKDILQETPPGLLSR